MAVDREMNGARGVTQRATATWAARGQRTLALPRVAEQDK